jgi:ribosomal protein S18 acetylase RimI-like enzyme
MRSERRSLRDDDFDEIYRSFVEAFSDYVVPMKPAPEALREMFTRRGWVPELSSGVFEGDRLVAFTINGFDGTTGYDTGSGVVPSHRRRGLARQTMEHSFELLRNAGATRYVLEVLEPNVAAAALYREVGFAETRRLDCWVWSAVAAATAFVSDSAAPEHTKAAAAAAALQRETWWDVQPSWQNSTASILRACDRYVVLGDDDSYAIVFPSTGDVPQFAVRREARRRGIGTRLLQDAAAIAGKPLRILNVDANVDGRSEGIAAFLAALGAQRFVRQIEMERFL